MTQPIVSKHWRKVLRIRLQSHQVHPTVLQYNTYAVWQDNPKNTNESRHSETGPVRQNPIQRTVTTAHLCTVHAYDCAQLQYIPVIQHRKVLIISPLTSRQPQMLSIGGEGQMCWLFRSASCCHRNSPRCKLQWIPRSAELTLECNQ